MSGRLVRDKGFERAAALASIMDVTLEPAIKRAIRKEMKQKAIEPMAKKIKSSANGAHGRRAALSVKPVGGEKPGITGGGKRGPLFYGSEFGGRSRNRTTTYRSRSRSGKHYLIHNRHTTMQFRPRVPAGSGYWFFPTFIRNKDEAMKSMGDVVSRTVARNI
jgi:hypothetical protein